MSLRSYWFASQTILYYNIPVPPDLQSSALARRGREYWHLDGLPTLVAATLYLAAVGLFLLLVHLLRHINDHSHKWSLLADLLNVFAGFAVITSTFWVLGGLIWLGINWEDLIEWFKLRITYPRTGYVAPPRYWQPDSSVASGDPVTTCQQSRLCRWLTIPSFHRIGALCYWGFCWPFVVFDSDSTQLSRPPGLRLVRHCGSPDSFRAFSILF